jgi:hypothetical protein
MAFSLWNDDYTMNLSGVKNKSNFSDYFVDTSLQFLVKSREKTAKGVKNKNHYFKFYIQEALKLYFVFKKHLEKNEPIDYKNEQTFGQKNTMVVKSNKTLDKFMLGFLLDEGELEVKFELDLYDFQTFMLFLKEQSLYFLTNDYLDFTKSKSNKSNKGSYTKDEDVFDGGDGSEFDW